MKTVALVPARSGSKRIANKNILDFCGKPLISWTIEQALATPRLSDVVVSTDDPKIAEISLSTGATVPFLRPRELATDSASSIDVIIHALANLPEVTHLLLLQPTSPLRLTSDIEEMIDFFLESSAKSMVSMSMVKKPPAWMFEITKANTLKRIRKLKSNLGSKESRDLYMPNGAMYFATREFLLEYKTFITEATMAYIMPLERSVDIDTPFDWTIAEFLMGKLL